MNGTYYQSPEPRSKPWYPKLAIFALGVFTILGIRPVANWQQPLAVGAIQATDLQAQLNNLDSFVDVKEGIRQPLIYSKSHLLMDSQSAEIIVSDNENEVVPIASTTKMVTALVVMDNMKLSDVATVSSKPPLIEGSKIGLKSGERITVANLLQGLLIYSGNDAAFALAEHYAGVPGDYEQFVTKMNEFVRAHGLKNTFFGDPAGLDSVNGHSTAIDLAHIARLVLENRTLADIVTIPNTTVSSTDGLLVHELKNSNRLVIPDSPYYLPMALGVKTGFTPEAGHCLVAAYRWQNRTLIGVVLNTNEYTITASASEVNKLFTWAERSLELRSY